MVGCKNKQLIKNVLRCFSLDGKMTAKQNIQNNVIDTMIEVAIEAQKIITGVRFGVEKWLLEE